MERAPLFSLGTASTAIRRMLLLFSGLLILVGLCSDSPADIAHGLWRIITEPDMLITDYVALGGQGAAFVNAGLVMLLSVLLLQLCRLPFSGVSIACCFLMGGFALFGKNLLTISPIPLGVWLYARCQRQPFSRYVYVALFGTALSPIITEMGLAMRGRGLLTLLVPLAVGMGIGFLLPPVSAFTVKVHQGYNLYNVGFSAGLLGVLLVAVLRTWGFVFTVRTIWSTQRPVSLAVVLFAAFGAMFAAGALASNGDWKALRRITRHSGRAIADFVVLDGLPVTLMNMGLLGIGGTAFVLAIGAPLNGPSIGGILTIVGFGAFGKHLANCVWVVAGLSLMCWSAGWSLQEPNILLAALFSTGLAPIAGQFGWAAGMAAGALHLAVVTGVGGLYEGMNLYNNGFAAGLVCIVLVPVLEALKGDQAE